MTQGSANRKESKSRFGAMEYSLILSLVVFSLPGLVEIVARAGG